MAEKTLIIGAGASGLSIGLFLRDSVILERSPFVGGHSVSTIDAGWTFDRGPHIMFSKDRSVLDAMIGSLDGNVHECRRNNKIFVDETLLHYPIENDLGSLSPRNRFLTVRDFVLAELNKNTNSQKPENLEDWFVKNFGESLTDLYFRPYNEKVWNVKLRNLSMLWADRIPLPPLEDVLRGALEARTEGYLHQLFYSYPKVGGYASLMVALEQRLQTNQVKTNMQVTKIRRKKGKLEVFSNGSSGSYEQIISTMPLLDLCKIVEDCPDEVVDAVRGLRINPMKIITFGFEGVDENQFTAVYVPSPEFSFNRVSYPGVFSPLNCPPGHHSIQVEITYPSDGTAYYESIDGEVAAKALSDLQQMNLAPHNPPIRTWVESFVHSYVVYESDYEERLSIARDYFEGIGIYIHGRFGAHEYLNVDGCILRSIDLAQKLDSKITREELLSRLVESPLKDRES